MNERIKVVWTILANRLMPLTRGIANTARTVSRSRVVSWTWWERLSEILELLQRMILIPTALLFLVILFVYAWPNAKRRVVVLEPIAVPTHFTELGLTSEVLTRDVREKMQEIQDVSDWVSSQAQLSSLSEEEYPEVEIPETKVSPQLVVDLLRRIFGKEKQRLSGELVGEERSTKLEIRSRLFRRDIRESAELRVQIDATDRDRITEALAIQMTELVDPYLLGLYLEQNKRLAEASAVAERILYERAASEPLDSNAHILLGLVSADQGNAEKAIWEGREAVRLAPDFAESHNGLGAIFQRLHNLPDAIAEVRRAESMDGENVPICTNLGVALL